MACSCATLNTLHAQARTGPPLERARLSVVGSEEERYARALQVAGRAPWHQWSLRPFGPDEARRVLPADASHPWGARLADARADSARARFRIVAPATSATFNSSFPYSVNDAAVWAGKGVTLAASAGADLRWGPLSIRAEPIVFVAQNAPFPLMPNGLAGDGRFADGVGANSVDFPQRFGDGRYARVDPGQSTVRLDAFGLTVGASTANEVWGPAQIDPLLLGANAPGIPRVFLGTSRPLSWGLGTIHVRAQAGELSESPYAGTAPDSSRRTMAGLAAVATIRGLPGLEIGLGRFYHRPYVRDLFRALQVPFEPFLKDQIPWKDWETADNQLASVFMRWTIPAAHLEMYGEFGRNDHSKDLRDLLGEPDHNSAYTIGATRTWGGWPRRLVALRVESMNARITHLARVRSQARWSHHAQLRQGHTHRGQLLGSAAGLGGAATTVAVDVYRPDGRWTVELARRVRQQPITESANASQLDVFNVLGAERVWFRRRADLTLGASVIGELNRDFSGDALGLRLAAGWRYR